MKKAIAFGNRVMELVDNLPIMNRIKNKATRMLIYYFFLGGITFVVDYALLFLLTEYAGIHYLLSAALAFVAGVIVNYVLNRVFNFKSESEQVLRQFIVFILVSLVGLAINELLLYVFVEQFHIHYLVARPILLVIVAPITFLLHKKFTFAQK